MLPPASFGRARVEPQALSGPARVEPPQALFEPARVEPPHGLFGPARAVAWSRPRWQVPAKRRWMTP